MTDSRGWDEFTEVLAQQFKHGAHDQKTHGRRGGGRGGKAPSGMGDKAKKAKKAVLKKAKRDPDMATKLVTDHLKTLPEATLKKDFAHVLPKGAAATKDNIVKNAGININWSANFKPPTGPSYRQTLSAASDTFVNQASDTVVGRWAGG